MLTSLGIGEAAITALNEKGIPTPLAATLLRAPLSRMDILNDDEIDEMVRNSKLVPKYSETIDRESCYEILNKKLEVAKLSHNEETQEYSSNEPKRKTREEKSTLEKILTSPTTKQIGRTLAREMTRGILGVLGLGGTTTRRKKSLF